MLDLGSDVSILYEPNNFQIVQEPDNEIIYPLISENKGGPCRNRTDDPRMNR